ncbi:hypothetical protein NLJ89_g8158 [Agrocybe chaxingu]|uniref:Glycoside hydrolase family 71 protein n=1 Tax=Agrocybe chaxingu TaxID=84603 RepID=A0A9W8JVZ2_9AGAR|nr:hypothetical protein NLJ89_g8158 [Agrocybe chaxingu]
MPPSSTDRMSGITKPPAPSLIRKDASAAPAPALVPKLKHKNGPLPKLDPSDSLHRALDLMRTPSSPRPDIQDFRWEASVEIEPGSEELAAGGGLLPEGESATIEAASRNFVFAHFMVGNTYPYTVDNWFDDIQLAASQDIDGFVLNVGREDWQIQRCADCFKAADRLPEYINFKLFFSFDMTSVPGNSPGDVQLFRTYLSAHANSARMFHHPRTGGIVVSTFSGENSTFGQGSMEGGWAYVKSELNKISPIYLIPSFFINPARYPNISAMDGAFNWNGGWPIQLHAGMSDSEIKNAKLDSDNIHLQNLTGGRTFMGAISPWFFTHYGPDSWNKNWIYRGDDWLFIKRWEQLISMRDRIDIAQIISWNDYGESHYIGPIKGAQPNSQAWVDGYPHLAWLHLNRYFAQAFKTGVYPAVTKDQIFMWARPHPKEASPRDPVPRPNNWQLTEDRAWVVVFATEAATIHTHTNADGTNKTVYQVKAGVSKLSFPLKPDEGMKVVMLRDGKTVAVCNPVGFRTLNANAACPVLCALTFTAITHGIMEGSISEQTSAVPQAPKLKRHSIYYLDHIIFAVEDTLFRVPRVGFEARSGSPFEAFASLQKFNSSAEGYDDDNPVYLHGVKTEDFANLLAVMYPNLSIESLSVGKLVLTPSLLTNRHYASSPHDQSQSFGKKGKNYRASITSHVPEKHRWLSVLHLSTLWAFDDVRFRLFWPT